MNVLLREWLTLIDGNIEAIIFIGAVAVIVGLLI
jgi:hypothetical protein